MKNNTFISICINLLAGILFSFPVFSDHINHITVSSETDPVCNISDSEIDFNVSAGIYATPANFYPEDNFYRISGRSNFVKNLRTGNKENTRIDLSGQNLSKYLLITRTLNRNNLDYSYVNLSYLKDLRTTKMLC